jgi:hypothetical protein
VASSAYSIFRLRLRLWLRLRRSPVSTCLPACLLALLVPIASSPQVISQSNMQQQTSFEARNIPFGSFDWKLTFKWLYSKDSRQPLVKPQWSGNPVENVFSSTMAGGLFSIHRECVGCVVRVLALVLVLVVAVVC